MCHNVRACSSLRMSHFLILVIPQIIDGRYHTECGHFYSMSTFQKDCGKNDCLFSSRHAPGSSLLTMIETRLTVSVDCVASSCLNKMAAPAHNPIRISKTKCGECTIREREGTRTLGVTALQLNVNLNAR